MQAVSAAFTTEERDTTRRVAQSTQVSWKKSLKNSIRFFTIGSSSIGGTDLIPGPEGVQSAWNKYQYEDETAYVTSLSYDRELNLPEGGLVKAQADISLDNTSNRFLPRYAGGTSAIFTAVLPRRPIIINGGFQVNGSDYTIPQFIGVNDRAVEINRRDGSANIHAVDFIDFLQNKFVDRTSMFTSQRSDLVIEDLLTRAGFGTAQYRLDEGINTIGFGIFETGAKMGDIIDDIVKAEDGHFYQDEEGRLRFENRQHWDSAPYNTVQRIITTSQVIDQRIPDTSRLINVVEVVASPRDVVDSELLVSMNDGGGLTVTSLPTGDSPLLVSYNDPVFEVTTPVPNGTAGQISYFVANTARDGSGTDVTTDVFLSRIDNFSQTSKLTFTNTYGSEVFLTTLDIWGRPARKTGDIYYREKVGSSITAYEEQVLKINNDYVQDQSWAQSLATIILQDFSTPEKITELTIRAIPELQMGDFISWQGRYWWIYGIQTKISPGDGFIQDIKIVQKTIHNYFKIGISSIGGTDTIAP